MVSVAATAFSITIVALQLASANFKCHADMIERGSHEGLPESQDRQDVQEKYNTVIQVLNQNHEIEILRR